MERLKMYLQETLASFKRDPSTSDFQRGYEAAIKEVLKHAQRYTEER